jgi:protein-L-isoaspartate(D-aspartate) O-methyltransferase
MSTKARPGFPAKLDLPAPGKGRDMAVKPNVSQTITAKPVAKTVTSAAKPAAKAVLTAPASGLGLDSASVRAAMVNKLAAQGVSDPRVLAAMGAVERHRFVDSALAIQAYEDTSLPIGLGQTISKPGVVSRMIELLLQVHAGKPQRLLEIGTGCGYQAAVLAQVATEVFSMERLRGLHEKARENLRPLRVPNLHLILGDGMLGFPQGAPYSGIIAAAGGEAVPQAWIDQLAVGGRLVAPVSQGGSQQALMVLDKTAQGIEQRVLEAVLFVPLKSGIA